MNPKWTATLADDQLRQTIDALTTGAAETIERYKNDAKSSVNKMKWQNRLWVVKWYLGPAWKTRWYHLFGMTPAWREWNSGQALRRADVRVVEPVALVYANTIASANQALIWPHVDGQSLHHWLKSASPAHAQSDADRAQRLRVARAIGQQIGLISAAGHVNRDHKASNLIIDDKCERGCQPLLIDPARIKRRRRDHDVLLMVTRLWRSTRRAGHVTGSERAAVLRGLVEIDNSLKHSKTRNLRCALHLIEKQDGLLQAKLQANRNKRQ